jgi:hypothetical protein
MTRDCYDSYKQISTERGEELGRRNSSGRKKNPLLPKKRSGVKSNEKYNW